MLSEEHRGSGDCPNTRLFAECVCLRVCEPEGNVWSVMEIGSGNSVCALRFAVTFFSMNTFISSPGRHGEGADGTERSLSLSTCGRLTTNTH